MSENTDTLNSSTQNHTRVLNSILGPAEKKVLLWLAARMPSWVVPDTLTAIGLFASFIIFLGYALTIIDRHFLWLASFGFVLNWFGDSLDGTLARYRKIERPRYGFFVDHIIDAASEVFIFVGIGISPYVHFELALFALIAYLLVSIYVYLATYVNGVFRISYSGISPTETRLLAVFANIFVFYSNNPSFQVYNFNLTFYDMVAIVITLFGGAVFVINSIRTASELSRTDRIAARERRIRERNEKKQERLLRRQEQMARRKSQHGTLNRRNFANKESST